MRRRRRTAAAADRTGFSGDRGNPTELLAWCRATGVPSRPHYLWGVLQAAANAEALGLERITVVEFGVAGGNGLLALEEAAGATEALLSPRIDVVGFDVGSDKAVDSARYNTLERPVGPDWETAHRLSSAGDGERR